MKFQQMKFHFIPVVMNISAYGSPTERETERQKERQRYRERKRQNEKKETEGKKRQTQRVRKK